MVGPVSPDTGNSAGGGLQFNTVTVSEVPQKNKPQVETQNQNKTKETAIPTPTKPPASPNQDEINDVLDIADVVNEAIPVAAGTPATESPAAETQAQAASTDVQRETIRIVAHGGDVPKMLINRGQEMRQAAENLSGDAKLIKQAEGYDTEIGGLQIQRIQEKNAKKQATLDTQITKLQQERDKFKMTDGKVIPNQFNELARALGLVDAKYVEGQIKNGSPLVAVNEIIKLAVTNKDVRTVLMTSLKESGFLTNEQTIDFEKQIGRLVFRENVKTGEKTVSKIGMGALLMTLMMMWRASKEKQQQQG